MTGFYENRKNKDRDVPKNVMEETAKALRTPYKYGAVIKFPDKLSDSATVFRYCGKWYMYYITISKDIEASGYETHLAVSEDLKHWDTLGTVMKRGNGDRWDSLQCAAYAAFFDSKWGGSNELRRIDGKYYVTYLGGRLNGYETNPLKAGLAYTSDPTDTESYVRLPEPILAPEDPDARKEETLTIYKTYAFEDTEGITGHKYVNAYNAKSRRNIERIFLAVSDDAEHWVRYGDRPVIDNSEDTDGRISGDPQIIRMGELYVMVYFKFRHGKPAFDTFACSYDLVKWTEWDGEPLIKSEYEWENEHAHKPWMIFSDGIVYHFYTAVNRNDERFIALAASEDIGTANS